MTDEHTRSVCVCVRGGIEWGTVPVDSTESHDGAASPPRGRVLRTRQDRSTTTTIYTLRLVSSSIGGEHTLSVHNSREVCHV